MNTLFKTPLLQFIKKPIPLKDVKRQLLLKQNDYTKNVKKILKKVGNAIITHITIIRTPVGPLLLNALDAVSMGSFSKSLEELPYDELYHLQIVCNINTGKKVTIEKNENINMIINQTLPENAETQEVIIPSGKTLNIYELLEKTKERMGKSFYPYQANSWNCQHFIWNILQANDLGNSQNKTFVLQEVKSLFPTTLRKLSNTVTDIGAFVNNTIIGGNIEKKKSTQYVYMQKYNSLKKDLLNLVKKHCGPSGRGMKEDEIEEMEGEGFISNIAKSAGKKIAKKGAEKLVDEGLKMAGLGIEDTMKPIMKKKGRFVKGSKEAKEFMASLRAKRKK